MVVDENLIVVQPVTKKAYDMGLSAAGLWRKSRRAGCEYSYSYFMNVASGRIHNGDIERFLEAEGFGPELKEAQANYQREQEAKKEATA